MSGVMQVGLFALSRSEVIAIELTQVTGVHGPEGFWNVLVTLKGRHEPMIVLSGIPTATAKEQFQDLVDLWDS